MDSWLSHHDDVDPALHLELCRVASYSLSIERDATCEVDLDGVWLPDPRTVSDDIATLWREAAAAVTTPAAIARLEDLLIARRDGKVGVRARRAVEGYLAAAASAPGDDYDAMEFLARAWTISRKFKIADLEEAALDLVEAKLDAAAWSAPASSCRT